MSKDTPVRVRFAPSPTGYLHIGGLRTALYNYCFARRHGGTFILRIEDTDQARFVDDAEDDLRSSLQWAGLTIDEGPDAGGPHGPYRQSERRALYQEHVEFLLEAGKAYRAFDTAEELDAMRSRHASDANPSPRYDAATREEMRNELTLADEEVQRLLKDGVDHVVRLKVDPGREISFQDQVRGTVTFQSETIDDQVLLKSDGLPTYHLANVVDDARMEITHVIRGEEWLPSTPKHALLYEAFGWKMPATAHLPLLLSPSGGKLSKRKAESQGVPVLVRDYRAAGYEPEALVNYLALLGWNPGDEREVFDLESLSEAFSLERVNSAGVRLDLDKLDWFNQQHLMRLAAPDLAARAQPILGDLAGASDMAFVGRVSSLMQERVTRLNAVAEEWRYFFEDPAEYDEKGLKKRWKDDSALLLGEYAERLAALESFSPETIEQELRGLAEQHSVGAGRIIHPTRLALSGVTAGPGLFDLMDVLGQEVCVRRMRRAVEQLD